jgi:hypothetical protein
MEGDYEQGTEDSIWTWKGGSGKGMEKITEWKAS